MNKVSYINANNEVTEIEMEDGENVMSLAVNNVVEGIVGECGGAQACATCHCYLDEKYAGHFTEVSDVEDAMLDMVPDRKPTSRLSCQLELTADTPDIEVHLPDSQY
jgi:2Fe-2S ferredoxin